jgi:hypothetical protein
MNDRTKKLLMLLLASTAVLVVTRFGCSGEETTSMPSSGGRAPDVEGLQAAPAAVPARGGRVARPLPTEVVELELARLEGHSAQFQTGRNVFVFYQPPPPPPPVIKGPSPEELARMRQAQEAQRRAEEAARLAADPPKPTPPAINLTYLGSFGPDTRRVAVFSDGVNITNALVGEVLDGKFRLVSIGYESVELAYVDFPDLRPTQLPVGP